MRECIAGQIYTARVAVRDSSNIDISKVAPTIIAADFLISINDGAWAALTNMPAVSPAGSEVIKIIFSAAETTAAGTGGSIVLRVADADGLSGWIGGLWEIPVRAAKLSELTAAQVNAEADTALADVGLTTTITGRIDQAISTRAPATTALSNATWTDAKAGFVDVAISSRSTAQQVWEYSTRTLSSFGTLIADMWAYATRTLTSFGSITPLVATVAGGAITVYAKDTWSFTLTSSLLTLTSYEAIAFAVKLTSADADADSILYVRSDTGLMVLSGAAATAGNGTLTKDSATAFSVKIAISATGVTAGRYAWWLKGFDTTPVTDEGYTLATGTFTILPAGVQAIS